MSTNPYETAEYQKFVESMAVHCRCRPSDRPCDGVLAGGVCDNIQDDPRDRDPMAEEDDE